MTWPRPPELENARPGMLAGLVVATTVRLLPAAERNRYDDEFRADLCMVRHGRQLPQALGLLAGAFTLRNALEEHDMNALTKSIKFWKCRIGRHHYRVVHDQNPENRQSYHLECTRCLRFKEVKEYQESDGRALGGIGLGG